MNNKFFGLFFVLGLAIVLALTTNVLADQWYEPSVPNINEMSVYVDGSLAWNGYCYPDPNISIDRWICYTYQYAQPGLDRGNTVEVKTVFTSNTDLKEVSVHTWVSGYSDDVEAETGKFDVFSGNTYSKTLELELPDDLDARDIYTLYVQIEQQHQLSGIDEAEIDTDVQRISNSIEILSADVYGDNMGKFAPGNTVYADVIVKNRGNYRAEDLYVRASITELGISRTVYIGDLAPVDDDDDEDSQEATLSLQLPANTQPGTYLLQIEAYNDEVSDKTTRNIVVTGSYPQQPGEHQGVVTVTPQVTSNEVEQGKGAVYSVLVANFGTTAQDFVVSTAGTEGWATTTMTPQAFTLAPGQSKLVNIYVAVSEDAVEAEHVFSANVKYGNDMKQVNLMANVKPASTTSIADLKTLLMIVGLVLAIVIIVLLAILLTKGKKEKVDAESYY